MFLMQYFCLHGILPFSKSYPEIESTWPTAKCRGRKSFDTWYYIVTCATLYVSFSSKSKAINVFPKHIVKSKARYQSNQARKKLFEQPFVKVFDQNRKHLQVRNQGIGTPAVVACKTVRSSHRRCCIRKLFLKILQYPRETALLESIFKTFADLQLY